MSSYGLQVGAYEDEENIPTDIDFGVNYKILKQGKYFKLILGPFDDKQQVEIFQKRYGIDGFVTGMSDTGQRDLRDERNDNLFKNKRDTNKIKYDASRSPDYSKQETNSANHSQGYTQGHSQNSYAVEVLSANNRNNVPPRIIQSISNLGLNPKFVLDKGLYRLVVGPYSSMSNAQTIASRIEGSFGRAVYVVAFDKNKLDYAQSAMEFVPQNNSNMMNSDQNEHIGYIEQQRKMVTNKYNNNPFQSSRSGFQERDPRINKQSGLQPYVDQRRSSMQRRQESQTTQNLREKFSQFSNTKSDSGAFFGVATSSSKNELIVNGKKVGGAFTYGLNAGFKFNQNTLIGVNYFLKEEKQSTVFIQQDNTAEIKSTYNYMISSYIKYRYFLPRNKDLFLIAKFGLGLTKQQIGTYIPITRETYNYAALYTEGVLGFGVGYFFTRISGLELMYDTYMNTKTITSAVKINFNIEF